MRKVRLRIPEWHFRLPKPDRNGTVLDTQIQLTLKCLLTIQCCLYEEAKRNLIQHRLWIGISRASTQIQTAYSQSRLTSLHWRLLSWFLYQKDIHRGKRSLHWTKDKSTVLVQQNKWKLKVPSWCRCCLRTTLWELRMGMVYSVLTESQKETHFSRVRAYCHFSRV